MFLRFFFARKREKKLLVFFWCFFGVFLVFFVFFARSANFFFLGLFFALRQAKPGIPALPVDVHSRW